MVQLEERSRLLANSRSLKCRLKAGDTALGAWLTFNDPAVGEIMANLGFDWLLVDAEHAPYSLESLTGLLMAFGRSDTVPLVRVAWNDLAMIKQVLDIGFAGVLVPYVCSKEEASRAVAFCKYPPAGVRGFGPRRASGYGNSMEDYMGTANEAVIVAIQIEHIRAVEAIEEIIAVPGIDVLVLGPMDLSASLGLLGKLEHPSVLAAMDCVIRCCNDAGLPVGIPMPADATAADVLPWVSKGCQFVFTGLDQGFLQGAAAHTLAHFRQQLSSTKLPPESRQSE